MVFGADRTTCHHWPIWSVKESVSHAVWVLPSRAAAGRSSGR